jgi:hypothetical protein
MKDINFLFLDKSKKEQFAEPIFRILFDNMKDILSVYGEFDDELATWKSAVLPALSKETRKIVLIRRGEELCGFLQYYVRDEILMIEELQLARSIQRTRALSLLLGFMQYVIPDSVLSIEAYAHKENQVSISLMERMGMKKSDVKTDERFYHLCGEIGALKRKR